MKIAATATATATANIPQKTTTTKNIYNFLHIRNNNTPKKRYCNEQQQHQPTLGQQNRQPLSNKIQHTSHHITSQLHSGRKAREQVELY
jgi:heat shock protein HspQ